MIYHKNGKIEPCCDWAKIYVTERTDQAYLEVECDGIYLIDPSTEPMGVLSVPIRWCPSCGKKTEALKCRA